MLVVTDLHKSYGPVPALAGFDLEVRPGEIAGLIGHNGAGKSTFARIVAGLVRPDRGHVSITAAEATGSRSPRYRLGLAPQEPALYPTATVRENLRVFGGLAGLRRAALRREIDDVAAGMRLSDLLHRRVSTLSGGQFRRVQTATALLHRPPVLLLDEPTVGADPLTREALLQVVAQRAAAGAAVCYTTHYLPELDALEATLAVASAGRVVARGTRADLLAGLPGELGVRFTGPVPTRLVSADRQVHDDELRIRTHDPARTLADLTTELASGPGAALRAVEVRQPSLDDLYRHLAVEPTR